MFELPPRFTSMDTLFPDTTLYRARLRSAVTRRRAARPALRAASSPPPPLAKKGSAARAPFLPDREIVAGRGIEQGTREHVDIEAVRAGCDHQFAELLHLSLLEQSRLVVERLQFRIVVAWLAHSPSFRHRRKIGRAHV